MEYLLNEHLFTGKFANFGCWAWLLPVIAALLTIKREKTEAQRAIISFAVGSFLLEYISSNRDILAAFTDGTNSPFYHLGVPIMLWLMSRIYLVHFNEWLLPLLYPLALAGFGILAILNALWLDGLMNFPTVTVGIYSLVGILLPLAYMLDLLRSLAIPRLDREPLFIAAAGMLIYYSGNLLLWLFLNYINNFEIDVFYSIYNVNTVLAILLNLFFAYAILLPYDQENTEKPLVS